MSRRISTSLPYSSLRQNHGVVTVDNINDLPDDILSHILSFLPTKDAVATGFLSKRWNLLWKTSINLDFCCPQNYTGNIVRFVRFVNYVLILHKPAGYFNKLSLSWEKGCTPFHVNTWISAAVARDVHELFVSVDIHKLPIHVQTCMFTSERLQSLELKSNICISSEKIEVSLPRLERLELTSVYFRNEEAFCKLIDGCPVLKYLVIHMDLGKMIKCGYIEIVEIVDGVAFKCIISSTSLTHLELFAYDDLTPDGEMASCSVQLDAPSLEFIKLKDLINSIVIQERLNFLGEANILLEFFEYETESPHPFNSIVEAFDAFACAKTLNLSAATIEALSYATIKMQTRFTRLKRLEVTIHCDSWSSLQDLIELSDNLLVLTVNKVCYSCENCENGDHSNSSNWKNPDVTPMCLANSLGTVLIGAYDGHPDEVAMVHHIIKHGSVLKVMQICFGTTIKNDFKRKYELVHEIHAVTRKSSTCEVKFHDYGSKEETWLVI